MNRFHYQLFIWKSHRGLAIFSILFIAFLQLVIIYLISSMDFLPIITAALEQIPPAMRAIVFEEFLTAVSVNGAAAFGLNHPMVIAILAIAAISIPTRHIIGEIESGTLELLLAYPIPRSQLLLSLWSSGSLYLLLVVLGGWVGSLISIFVFSTLTTHVFLQMLQIAANLWLLFTLIMSFTLLISTFGKEGSRAGTYAAAIVLVFYLLDFISGLWDALKFTIPFNIFTYYQPQKLMFGERSFWLNVGVLIGLIGICLVISLRQFQRRDIP